MPGLADILTLGAHGAREKIRESEELMKAAHEAYWPIIQKGVTGDPSIPPDTWDFAMGRYAAALSSLGKRGKIEAENFKFAAQRQRDISQKRAALEQFKTAPLSLPPGPMGTPTAPVAMLPPGSPVQANQPGGGMIADPGLTAQTEARAKALGEVAGYQTLEPKRQAMLREQESRMQSYMRPPYGLAPEQAADLAQGKDVRLLPITNRRPGEETLKYGQLIGVSQQPRFESQAPGTLGRMLYPIGGPEGLTAIPPPFVGGASGGSGGASVSPPPSSPTARVDTLEGPPPPLPGDVRVAKSNWIANHPGQPWSDDKLAEAVSEYKERSMSTTEKELAGARIVSAQELRAQRALNAQRLGLELQVFRETHDPKFIQSFVDAMKKDPDLYWDPALKSVQPLVATAWMQQTGLPTPRKLEGVNKTTEVNSQIALGHAAMIEGLIDDPVVLKRMGAALGRLGSAEQAIGATAGLSAEDAKKIQQFRTSLEYFFLREGKSLMSGRPAERLMTELRKASPNVNMALPLLRGAIAGAKGAAQTTVDELHNYRFGSAPGTKPGTGTATPPPAKPVKMKAPTGQVKEVPADQVEFYKSKGAVVVK